MTAHFVTKQTQKNWWIDSILFSSALVAALTGVYFLFLPTGGFQGGRNPLYGIQILFARQTWDDLHTWGGIIMIAAATVHLVVHWSWVKNMARRVWYELTGRCGCMNARGHWNLILNAVIAVSFSLAALSGVYFLFAPGGRRVVDPMILFPRTTWDLIHTWGGIILLAAAIIHFAIHWKWIAKVTQKMIWMAKSPQTVHQTITAANS